MRIETGHSLTNNIAEVAGTTVRFIAEDGRTMFEVSAMKDGKSISVRGVETCVVGGVMYSSKLEIKPIVSNSIEIHSAVY
jgi:hypothetical protein